MDVKKVVIIVFVLLIVLYFIINAFSKTSKLTEMADAKILQTIKAASLKNGNNSMNFTYSMWIYVDNWNYMFGSKKIILSRGGGPDVILGDKPNTLTINIKYLDASSVVAGSTTTTTVKSAATNAACTACNSGYTCACAACQNGVPDTLTTAQIAAAATAAAAAATAGSSSTSACQIDNIPLQKWVNVIISLYGQTLDTYIDGKLVRTCVIKGVPNINNSADILVTPGGGFSGYTTTFKYWANASNPQDAYNIYKDGFGGSILGNALSKFRLRFSFISGNVEKGSFEI